MKQKPVPRRRKKNAAARLRPFWLLLILLLIACGIGSYAFVTAHTFYPHTIDVSGNRIVSKDQVLNAAAIDLHANIWLQNGNAIARRIEAVPYIATASVQRLPPSTVVIDVTERAPFARLEARNGIYLIDDTLRVLQPDDGALKNLPLLIAKDVLVGRLGSTIADPGVAALRDDENALSGAKLPIASLQHDKYGDLVATLHNGVRVLFGEESDLQKKVALVDPILTQVGKAGRPIAAIDLRAVNTPVVVYKK